MPTLKPQTWTYTESNTPERYAAVITDAVNLAIYYKELGRWSLDHDNALRTLMTLKQPS